MKWNTIVSLLGIVTLIIGTATQQYSESSSTSDTISIGQLKLETTNIGKYKYQDGEVFLYKNERRPSSFFFTPFPYLEPNLTDCYDNVFSGYTELILMVSLYTTDLYQSVENHIKKHQNICRTEHCDVSLLPMNSIRLVRKGLVKLETQKKFTLSNAWQSNALLQHTIKFIIYVNDMITCESFKKSIISRCHLPNLEIQYSLHSQQTASRNIEVTTDHITKTSMYNQIKSQFPSDKQETVALTGSDYKNLLSETVDQITMSVRIEEDYESIADPVGIDQLLARQLQQKQVQITGQNHYLWESLYWTPELTRPDRLSRVINKVLKRDSMNSDKFLYDYSHGGEAVKQSLTLHDRQKFENFNRYLDENDQWNADEKEVNTHERQTNNFDAFFMRSNSATDRSSNSYEKNENSNYKLNETGNHNKTDTNLFSNTNNQRQNSSVLTMTRKDAEQLLHYLSTDVETEGDIIKPKPINVTLVKFGSLKYSTRLFTNSIQVKTRKNVHELPLNCPYEFRHHPSTNIWMADKYDRLSKTVDNFTNLLNEMESRLMLKIEATKDLTYSSIEQATTRLRENAIQKMDTHNEATNSVIDQATSRLQERLLQEIKTSNGVTNSAINQATNQLQERLLQEIKESNNVTNSAINQATNRLEERLLQEIKATNGMTNSSIIQTRTILHQNITDNAHGHTAFIANVLSTFSGYRLSLGGAKVIESITTYLLSPLIVTVRYIDGTWFRGTVCDDLFNTDAALAACLSWNSTVHSASFSSLTWTSTNICASGFEDVAVTHKCQFILDDVVCNSSSYSSLKSCSFNPVFSHNCGDSEHINLVCNI